MPSDGGKIEVWIRDWGMGKDPRKRAYVVGNPIYDHTSDAPPPAKPKPELPAKAREFEDVDLRRDKPKAADDPLTQTSVDPAKILAEPLAKSILERLAARDAVDRTAAADQITGQVYTDKRREELKAAVGADHYLLKAYGMRTIRDMTEVSQRSGLRVDHALSAVYLRDAPENPVRQAFVGVYEKVKRRRFIDGQMFLVNSGGIIAKLDAIYGPQWTDVKPGRGGSPLTLKPFYQGIEKLADGMHVITMKSVLSAAHREAFQDRMLDGVGATPSSYQAVKQLNGAASPPLTDPALLAPSSLDNAGALAKIKAAPGLATLKSLPEGHPMATIGKAAAQMIEGLEKQLTAKTLATQADAFNRNKLVAGALGNIAQLMAAMPTYMDDVPRFSRLFDVMVDEVHLVLATCKPYGKDDFKAASKTMMERRAPALKDIAGVTNETCLLSSGMDTIATAVQAAQAATRGSRVDLLDPGSRDDPGANYFEIQANLLAKGKIISSGPIIIGSLNPSTPDVKLSASADTAWTVDTLIATIEAKVGTLTLTPAAPAVVIIDVTVEKHAESDADKEINKIILKFKTLIEQQKLQIMLCKSYQKYPSLGSGKAMAGGLTVIGKGPKAGALLGTAQAAETAGNFHDNDETQLVDHFMTHEHDMETPMLDRAQQNAAFLKGVMPAPATPGAHRYVEGLPFLVVNDAPMNFDLPGDPPYQSGKKSLLPHHLLYPLGVEKRMSFGFQNSSCLSIPGGVRIGAGQESEGELVEKFYAFLQLSAASAAKPGPRDPRSPPIGKATIGGYAHTAADKAFKAAKPHLLAGKGSAAWRVETAKTLIKHAVLRSTDVTFSAAPEVTKLGALTEAGKIDTRLEELLGAVEAGRAPSTPGALLAARLALVASCTTVKTDDALRMGDDVNLMHASLKRVWKDKPDEAPEADTAHLPNIVASCAMMIGNVFTRPEDAADFIALADPLIESGLDQLSPDMREKLLAQRMKAALAGGVAGLPGATDKIGDCVAKMPYREGGANFLKGQALAGVLAQGQTARTPLSQPNRDKLVEACTAELDLPARVDLLNTLGKSASDARAEQRKARTDATEARRLAVVALRAAGNDRRAPAFKAADAVARAAETLADETEQRAAAHPGLAKSVAAALKTDLAAAELAMATDKKPLAQPRLGALTLDGARAAPQPMTPEAFTAVKDRATRLIALAEGL
ncbi:MAG TPA: hypothetical protein VM689_27070 [Aliidongia sp.]|nr:hypothetical protein [Aliidongia sp.]